MLAGVIATVLSNKMQAMATALVVAIKHSRRRNLLIDRALCDCPMLMDMIKHEDLRIL